MTGLTETQCKAEIRRARWRRNKREQRMRARIKIIEPPTVEYGFAQGVWEERDRRLKNFPWRLPALDDGRYYPERTHEATYPLICDVWAAELLITAPTNGKRLSDGKIAKWLFETGRAPNVKPTSLRILVGRARATVRYLEDAPARDGNGRFWPKYPEKLVEMGSGLMQHVGIVSAMLELYKIDSETRD